MGAPPTWTREAPPHDYDLEQGSPYTPEALQSMTNDPNAALFEDPAEADLEALLRIVLAECQALGEALPEAYASQWKPAPIPKPREDTTERAKGGHADPTPSVALDGRRLALRAQVLRSERVVRDTVVAVRGVRRGLELALSSWEGERREDSTA